MSKSRRRKEATPVSSAGLIAYYEEDLSKVKINPGLLIILSVLLVSMVLLLNANIIAI